MKKLDKWYIHEALDRTYCVQNIVEDMLSSHPVISKSKKLSKKLEKAQKILADVYFEISNL